MELGQEKKDGPMNYFASKKNYYITRLAIYNIDESL